MPDHAAVNILVHQGALGDWVLTWPVLRSLAASGMPTWAVTSAGKANLAAGGIDHVHAADIDTPDWTALFAPTIDETRAADHASSFEQVRNIISFVSNGTDMWAANIRALAPHANVYFVAPNPPTNCAVHVTDWHREQLRAQGCAIASGVAGPIGLNLAGGSDHVVVHPGSGGIAKCWPVERFEQLIEKLLARDVHVQVLLGEVELEQWPLDLRRRWMNIFDVKTLTTLDALHDELVDAGVYVGNDSGPTHLAAQLRVRTVALFGPTAPRVWSPVGPEVHLLAPDIPCDMNWLEVDRVFECVVRVLEQ